MSPGHAFERRSHVKSAVSLTAWIRRRAPRRPDGAYSVPEGTEIVVNATSTGLLPVADARLELDLDSLRPGMVVADMIRTRRAHD